jgi:hypothetical protein
MSHTFDSGTFLREKFKSPPDLLAFLTRYGGRAPREAAIDKWFRRGSIPSDWLPVMLALLEIENGRPVSLAPYLTKEVA